jgi:serine/threonine-protein kinase
MSPEQARGDKGLDARTDFYSLAAVLYEMLAGQPPYVGATTQALIVEAVWTEPRRASARCAPNVSEGGLAIRKALAPVPADRFGVRRRAGAGLAPTATTAATAAAPDVRRRRQVSSPRRRARTVRAPPRSSPRLRARARRPLRLAPPAGSARSEPARSSAGRPPLRQPRARRRTSTSPTASPTRSEGKLAGIEGLQVTASRSAAEYKKSTKDLATIARELGVDYLLVGKVRWEKGDPGKSRVRVESRS